MQDEAQTIHNMTQQKLMQKNWQTTHTYKYKYSYPYIKFRNNYALDPSDGFQCQWLRMRRLETNSNRYLSLQWQIACPNNESSIVIAEQGESELFNRKYGTSFSLASKMNLFLQVSMLLRSRHNVNFNFNFVTPWHSLNPNIKYPNAFSAKKLENPNIVRNREHTICHHFCLEA